MYYNILSFGASPDSENCTAQIQKAIDTAYLAGGGAVEIPAGTFRACGLRLRSHVTLLLRAGAVLLASRNPADYDAWLSDELEPVAESDKLVRAWKRGDHEIHQTVGSRWNNGIIRALDATDVAIIGEAGSVIDGNDCFDADGEEYYRGPHGIAMHRCRNIRLSGCEIRNTGNWAASVYDSENITLEKLLVLRGHDGCHFTGCDNITVRNCRFFTGDDCIAGIDLCNVTVTDCELNTACSGFRMGGTNIHISKCYFHGPGKYLFRGSLSPEEKANNAPSLENPQGLERDDKGHRFNMLSCFTYYADFSHVIRHTPENIVISDCRIENCHRLLHYNFSGNETWQKAVPMRSFTMENCTATGIVLPLNAYGDEKIPLLLTIRDCELSFREETPFMHLCNYERVLLENLKIHQVGKQPLIKKWSEGEIVLRGVTSDNKEIVKAEEAFFARPI